jgi:phosphoadenosine phosphosulfate reductase
MTNSASVAAPVAALNLEKATAGDRVRWAAESFGDRLVMTTSFGIQSAVMLHLVTRTIPEIPVVFIDTGYLFPETYRFAEQLTSRLKLNLRVFNPAMTAARQEALYGREWEQGIKGIERYNFINKVEPMERAVRELGAVAWLTGLRRAQASTRRHLKVAHQQNKITKVHPIVDWDDRRVYAYLKENDLPYHPLWEQGYASVGDWHSTSKLFAGMTEEETRFGGLKRECGLHEGTGRADYQI